MTLADSGWEANQAIDDRPVCPACNTPGPTELHFGLVAPIESDFEAWKRLRITFAGCMDEGLEWQCQACLHEWGRAEN